MNERIQELAEQAIINTNLDGSYIPEKFLENFAEMIVGECIGWCNVHSTVDGTAQKIVKSIKEYFGIKE